MLQAEVTTAEEPVVDDPAEGELPKLTSLLKMHQPGNPLGSEQKFWLLGTAHVSARSSQDVRCAIHPGTRTTALLFTDAEAALTGCASPSGLESRGAASSQGRDFSTWSAFFPLHRRLVRAVKPQVVMIELCPARRGILTVQKLKVCSS